MPPLRYRILAVIGALVVGLDQWSKQVIVGSFDLYQSLTVVENFFHITYVRNRGAAFGMLADSPLRVPFFIGVTLVACGIIVGYLHRLADDRKLAATALALIFGGAIGNLIDRVSLGEVIDFIDVHWYQHHWPAFNIADSAICVGVGLLLLDMWRHDRKGARETKEEGS
ncbi:signal peptidase II [Geothermobacter ehrlichii]|uniref:Lipoprotein signal peptidase n=2 Tax=Geothermobacter ehrlichii TaxID=213224 RepID=A0A5D3WMJ2_9BACT|nr:signal peptidase II [Geothermobacter ehrlichii]TYO98558.1 signal peptidase II [Geothermobacter ehrlichii]